jgi:hypothetical protein
MDSWAATVARWFKLKMLLGCVVGRMSVAVWGYTSDDSGGVGCRTGSQAVLLLFDD